MTQMPETAHGAAYAPSGVTQFSIFLENRVGKMLELVKGFDEAMCRICALSVHDSTDHAVVRLVANNSAMARQILAKQNLTFMETDILIVAIDAERTLSRMCQFLLGAELNIRFSYPLMGWEHGPSAIALAVDDPTLAAQILRRKDFRLVCENELPKFGE